MNRATLSLSPVSTLVVSAIVLSLSAGCPPVREGTVGDGLGGGNSLQTALIATDPWTGTDYSLAYVYLVDADHTCQEIFNNYGLAWWNLSSETQWVTANVYKGQFVDWESDFRSQYLWNQTGQNYSQADYFGGGYGSGGYGTGDDDDALPPAPGTDSREQEGNFGDLAGIDDTLTIRSWSEDRVRGYIEAEAGSWEFDAVYCGDLPGNVVGIGDGEADGETFPDDS